MPAKIRYNRQGKRPRDSQRSKVYAAEHSVSSKFRLTAWAGESYTDLVRVQGFVDAVTMSDLWKELRTQAGRWSHRVTVAAQRSGAGAMPERSTIYLSRDLRQEPMVVCHELAHLTTTDAHAWHGPEFARIYLRLVAHFMGRVAYEALRSEFAKHRVRC